MNAKGGSRGRTALHYASLNDHLEVAVLLLQAGTNEFSRDVGGYTPLNLSKGGRMVELLHKVCTVALIRALIRGLTFKFNFKKIIYIHCYHLVY